MPDISSFALLGLGPATGNWFMRLATYAEQQGELATSRVDAGPRARGNAAALRDLVHKLHQMRFNPEDPLAILGMHVFHLTGRTDPSQPYVPSESARTVLHRVGQEQSVAWTEVLMALFAAEVKDMVRTVNRRNGDLVASRHDLEEARTAREAAERKLTTERGARVEAESEVARLRAELDQTRAENSYLSATLEGGNTDDATPEPLERPVDDYPSEDQLTKALDGRVKIGTGLHLQRHEGTTFYAARWSAGSEDRFAWIAPAVGEGAITVADAMAARRRLIAADTAEVS